MDKKAVSLVFTTIIVAILGLVVLTTMLYGFEKPASKLFKTMSQESLYNSQEQCRIQGQRKPGLLQNDNDEYPNTCDICPWYDSSLDADGDYMPDECDKDMNNAQVFECRYGVTDKGQCAKEEKKLPETAPYLPTPEEKARENEIEAQSRFEAAKEQISKDNLSLAYELLMDVLKNYKGTRYYDKSFNELVWFERWYTYDTKKLFQFYRDMAGAGYKIYLEKMAMTYKSIIKAHASQKNFTQVEEHLRLMEKDIGNAAANISTVAGIYYHVAGSYLSAGDKTNAGKYYRKVIKEFPDSKEAESAMIAVSPPRSTSP